MSANLENVNILTAVRCKEKTINLPPLGIYVLSSPHFTLSYPNNAECLWILRAKEKGVFVILPGRIVHFDSDDSLIFGAGSSLTNTSILFRYPNRLYYVPDVLVIANSSMWVHFVSDHFDSRTGFYVTIERHLERKGNYVTDYSPC